MDDDTPHGEGVTEVDDGGLRRAIEMLIEAVAKEVRPGDFEMKLAASRLRDLLEDPTPECYSQAARAFGALDGEARRRIQANAEDAATIFCTGSGRQVTVRPAPPPGARKPRGGGLLQALTFGLAGGGRGRRGET